MSALFTYLFWPNPGNASYTSPKAVALLVVCTGLIALSFFIRRWRRGMQNPVSKRLSRTWGTATFWFGFTGIIFVVARVEDIQFIAMRFLWVLWGIAALVYVGFQVKFYRARHYEVLPQEQRVDPRDRYLPTKKKH